MLNELAEEIHSTAIEKGWWGDLSDYIGLRRADMPERNFGEIIALIHSEASEVLEEYRVGAPINQRLYEDECNDFGVRYEDPGNCPNGRLMKPVGVPSEMADIIIRVLDTCAAYGIDIDYALREKVDYNKTRPPRHGGKLI